MIKKTEKNLFPEKRVSSIGFILNDEQKILLVKPSYYNYWHLPGGFVDEGESPLEAVSREISEEINLDIQPIKLMMINFNPGEDGQKEVIVFIFDFGQISNKVFKEIRLDNHEIIDFGFFDMEKAVQLVGPDRGKRLELCFQVHRNGKFLYLDDDSVFQ